MKKESTLTQSEKEYFMREALKEAQKAEAIAEVPIGAVVVLEGQIIGRGHNYLLHWSLVLCVVVQ